MATKSPIEAGIDDDRQIALHLLQTLIGIVGDAATMTVDLWRVHKVILVMRGIVVEADETITRTSEFDRVAASLAYVIAEECKSARLFRNEHGIGLMDLVLQDVTTVH